MYGREGYERDGWEAYGGIPADRIIFELFSGVDATTEAKAFKHAFCPRHAVLRSNDVLVNKSETLRVVWRAAHKGELFFLH